MLSVSEAGIDPVQRDEHEELTVEPKKVLTIAGSDCSGGAGIQADLKTFQERDVYGMSVVTVLVAMQPETWHHIVMPVPVDDIRAQLPTVFPGIGAAAVKTGMLPTAGIIELVGSFLKDKKVEHLVVDPVMVCKGAGQPLFPENTAAMIKHLLPIAEVVTPNTFEAAQLSGMDEPETLEDLKENALHIQAHGTKNVIIKAARIFPDKAVNLLYDGKEFTIVEKPKVNTAWTHGAGCSFSACVTAELAKGASVKEAFLTATEFVFAGLERSFPLNQFVGPIYHKALAKQGK